MVYGLREDPSPLVGNCQHALFLATCQRIYIMFVKQEAGGATTLAVAVQRLQKWLAKLGTYSPVDMQKFFDDSSAKDTLRSAAFGHSIVVSGCAKFPPCKTELRISRKTLPEQLQPRSVWQPFLNPQLNRF
eukprot:6492807-Amphidinium_carterae.1